MPIKDRSPFVAEWNGISDDGEPILRELKPEDLLTEIAEGMTPEELAVAHDAPVAVIEDLIMKIPLVMAWRRKATQQRSLVLNHMEKLPDLPGENT